MELKFYDPLQARESEVQSLDQLIKHLSVLPGKHHIRFLTNPFPLDPQFLKDFQLQTYHEKIRDRFTFECEVQAENLTQQVCESLLKLHFTHVYIPFDPNNDLGQLAELLQRADYYNLGLNLRWIESEYPPSEGRLAEVYHFLKSHLGSFKLHIPSDALLAYASQIGFYLNRLGQISKEFTPAFRFNRHLNERFYQLFYEYLKNQLSHNVKTILEINPHGDRHFYKDFPRQNYPWKVTTLTLDNKSVSLSELQELGKTYDAIVFFQALESMRDPKKDLLFLQNHSRHTTEWAVFNYNLQSLPILMQLLENNFDNAIQISQNFDNKLKLFSPDALHKMFEFLGVHFNLQPIQVPVDEYLGAYQHVSNLLKQGLDQNIGGFESHAKTMAIMGVGSMLIDDFKSQEDGFISSGFLS